MADKDDELLQKADALMRRRRIFVAGANDADGGREEAAAANADDDVPLLTDVVEPDALAEVARHASVDVFALRAALAAEIETWVDKDLPLHVQRVLDGITDQLILRVSEQTRLELLPRLQALVTAARDRAKPAATDD
jgi:hypothetical protein